jgi:hypothetical protein
MGGAPCLSEIIVFDSKIIYSQHFWCQSFATTYRCPRLGLQKSEEGEEDSSEDEEFYKQVQNTLQALPVERPSKKASVRKAKK